LEEVAMSHKNKKRREVTNQSDHAVTSAESEVLERAPADTKKTPTVSPAEEEGGFSWQLIFVIVAIAMGFLVLIGKTAGLF
jgi:hypothetical protein